MQQSSFKQRIFTPLGIIALFISLSEAIAGIVVTQTSSATQIILTVFVVFFPIIISTMFFYVLWNRPQVFYHPKEYGGEADVATFTKAMELRFKTIPFLSKNIEDQILISIEDKKIAEEIINNVRKKEFIEIDTTQILGKNGEIVRVPYREFQSIGLLLKFIWFEAEVLDVHSYNKEWIIKDVETGEVFKDIGSIYARTHFGTKWDERSLKEVGIYPGSRLSIEALNYMSKSNLLSVV